MRKDQVVDSLDVGDPARLAPLWQDPRLRFDGLAV
jgi:hypothetical protein